MALRLAEGDVAVAQPVIGPIGKPGGVIADDHFCRVGHHVNGSIRPIDDFFGMCLSEFQIAAGMTGVGAGRGIAASKRHGHGGVPDRAFERTVPHTLKLAVPGPGCGSPHFEIDRRISGRRRHRDDPAEGRQGERCKRGRRAGRREGTRGCVDRGENPDLRQRERGEARTGCAGRRRRSKPSEQQRQLQ